MITLVDAIEDKTHPSHPSGGLFLDDEKVPIVVAIGGGG